MRRKILAFLLPLAVGLSLCACESKEDKIQEEGDKQEALMEAEAENEEAQEAPAGEAGGTVAILLANDPAGELEESEVLVNTLKEAGYAVELSFANGQQKTQKTQLEGLALKEIRGLILEPVQPEGLDEGLEAVSDTGAYVVSYKDLVMDTEYVDAYVTFDYYSQGKETGEWLEDQLELEGREVSGPAYMEVLAGDSINERVYYMGLMEVLSPYDEEGVLVAASGADRLEVRPEKSGQKTVAQCQEVLRKFYGDKQLDAVCATSDKLAGDMCRALDAASYEVVREDEPVNVSDNKLWPVVTGCEIDAGGKSRIAAGWQSLSSYGSREELAKLGGEVLHSLILGDEPDDPSKEYDNGVKIVDAYLAGMDRIEADDLIGK
ncbi:MAG: substrate-binding domain-containing protein [Blautia sp.]|jgi:putative multiple sugar transport system substrate-binding protein